MSGNEARKVLVVILWQPKAGAAEKKILLLHLLPSRGAFWQPVTGGVEKGESFAEGALREAEEETGLTFDRQPQYLGLEHTFESRHGEAVREQCFFLCMIGGSQPPNPILDGKEHDAFAWLTPEEAAERVKYPGNRAAIERAASGAAPLLLTKRGIFLQDGEEILHQRTVDLLHNSLEKRKRGYFVQVGKEELEVVLEGKPRFVLSFDRVSGKIHLLGGREETLNPLTLEVQEDNSLSCVLENGWEATLLAPAYYELAKNISEDSKAGEHRLHFGGRDYLLGIAGQRKGKDR